MAGKDGKFSLGDVTFEMWQTPESVSPRQSDELSLCSWQGKFGLNVDSQEIKVTKAVARQTENRNTPPFLLELLHPCWWSFLWVAMPPQPLAPFWAMRLALASGVMYGLPRWLSGKKSACQGKSPRRHGFDPWVGKIPWRRKWKPTLVFLPGKSHGWRSLEGYSPWGRKESDTTEMS